MDFDEVSYTLVEKAKIKSLKNINRKIICMYNASLYASDKFCNWRNLRINGFLTFEIDYELKTRFICLYEMDYLDLLFQYELYTNFENNLSMCESNFLSFEIDGGFIGIQFIYDNEAFSFKIFVLKYTQKFILNMIEKKSYDFSEEYKNSALVTTRKKILCEIYTNIIKTNYKEISENYENEEKLIMQSTIEENNKNELTDYLKYKSKCENVVGMFKEIIIKKIKNLSYLSSITFDRKIKKFNIDNIPTEMKKALTKNGIKKHQFNDNEFALNIFKNFIENYDKNNNYLIFFGRLVKDKKHRKALDWVGLVRKKKNEKINTIFSIEEENFHNTDYNKDFDVNFKEDFKDHFKEDEDDK